MEILHFTRSVAPSSPCRHEIARCVRAAFSQRDANALRRQFPGAKWLPATPAEAGLDEVRLREARDYALSGGGSGCIVRGGKLVFAWGDLAQRYDLKSTTKSFGAAHSASHQGRQDAAARQSVLHHSTFGTPPESNAQAGWLVSMFRGDRSRSGAAPRESPEIIRRSTRELPPKESRGAGGAA